MMSTEKLPLIKDTQTFLDHLSGKQLPLTQTGNLKLKDVSLICDLFIWPNDLEKNLRLSFISRARSEYEIKYLHFIRILCQVAGLVKIRNKKISTTAKVNKFLQSDNHNQLVSLFYAWFSKLNWNYFARTDTDILECLQEERLSFLFNLQALRGISVPFEAFTKTIIDRFPFADFVTEEQVEFEVKLFVSYLAYFGLVEIERRKSKYNFLEDYAFSVTAQGKKIIQEVLRVCGIETDLTTRALKLLNQPSNN